MTTDQDMLNELDQEPVIAEAWIPDTEGDTIIGLVETVTLRTDGDYDPYHVVVIKTDDGELAAVHGFGTVLAGHIDRDKPQPGDRYAIRYAGERASKNGRTYKDWRTAIRRGPMIPVDTKKTAAKKAPAAPAAAKTVDSDGIEF